MSSLSAEPTVVPHLRREERGLVAMVALGIFITNLDVGIVNVILPALSEHFALPPDAAAYTVAVYVLAVSSTLLFFGRLVDRVSRLMPALIGMVLIGLGGAACAASGSFTQLLICRYVQGLGGALFLSAGTALIYLHVPAHCTGRAMSLLAFGGALGLCLGPPLGGLIAEAGGWRLAFLLHLPAAGGVVVLGARLRTAFQEPVRKDARLDLPGGVLAAAGLSALVMAVHLLRRDGLDGRWGVPLGAVGALALGLFLWRERRAASPILPRRVFACRALQGELIQRFASMAVAVLLLMLFPFFLRDRFAFGPGKTGVAIMAVALLALAGGWLAGVMTDRRGTRSPAAAGLLLQYLALGTMAWQGPSMSAIGLAVSAGAFAIGYALFLIPNLVAILTYASAQEAGVYSGLLSLVGMLGSLAGACLFGLAPRAMALLTDAPLTTTPSVDQQATGSILLAMLAAAMALLAVLPTVNRHAHQREDDPSPTSEEPQASV